MPHPTERKNQFFIITALQLINAVEYIYQTGKQNEYNELVLCTVSYKVKQEAATIFHLYKWSNIIELLPDDILNIENIYLRSTSINIHSKRKLKKIFDPGAELIFGHERNVFCKYISKKAKKSVQVLLDDGAGSVAFKHDNVVKNGGRIQKLTEKFFGVHGYHIQPEYFFTAYKDKIDPAEFGSIKVIENNFNYLKKIAGKRKVGKDVYFIGDPLVERNVISEEDYFNQIAEVKKVYPDSLIYIPRSTEDPDKVSRIAEMVEILRPGVPFEVFLVSKEELPLKIIGYHTSVIFNTHKIFGGAVELYHIKLKEFKREIYKEILPKMYKELDLISKEWPAASKTINLK